METSTIRDIGNIYHLIDQYTNTFVMFYEPIPTRSTALISNGENDASRFITTFHGCERLDDLKRAILELLIPVGTDSPSQINDLKRAILELL